jgi:hypothetical protein
VFVRRLRPGKTCDDFIDAWYPDKGFGGHVRIDDVIESTTVRGICEVEDEFDFSTDETVARGRP